MVAKWANFSPQLLSLLRIITAFMFIAHGTMKLFNYPVPMPPGMVVTPWTEVWFAGVLETFGGALLLIGLFTRPVAFLLSGEMAFAYFKAHAPQGFWPAANGGELAVFYCFVMLFFSAAGAGAWSVDALIRRHSRASMAPWNGVPSLQGHGGH